MAGYDRLHFYNFAKLLLLTFREPPFTIREDEMEGFALGTGGSFMAVVQPDLYRYENLVRKSIQIPSTRHKELKALAVELESSLGDVVETIMDLMRQDNYEPSYLHQT